MAAVRQTCALREGQETEILVAAIRTGSKCPQPPGDLHRRAVTGFLLHRCSRYAAHSNERVHIYSGSADCRTQTWIVDQYRCAGCAIHAATGRLQSDNV